MLKVKCPSCGKVQYKISTVKQGLTFACACKNCGFELIKHKKARSSRQIIIGILIFILVCFKVTGSNFALGFAVFIFATFFYLLAIHTLPFKETVDDETS